MPTREEILHDKTYKEDGIALEKRVFYTLRDAAGEKPQSQQSWQVDRNSKAISMVIKTLPGAPSFALFAKGGCTAPILGN